MGISGSRRSGGSISSSRLDSPCYSAPSPDRNPDPNNYNIIEAEQIGKYLLLKINYPNCKNFEGNKILVFKDTTAIDILKQKSIDPHFFESKQFKSPIARFVPTADGWNMAKTFIRAMQ